MRNLSAVATSLIFASPVCAHHSDAALDMSSLVLMKGKVTEFSTGGSEERRRRRQGLQNNYPLLGTLEPQQRRVVLVGQQIQIAVRALPHVADALCE